MTLKSLLVASVILAATAFGGGTTLVDQFSGFSAGGYGSQNPTHQSVHRNFTIPEGMVFKGCETSGTCKSFTITEEYSATNTAFQFVCKKSHSEVYVKIDSLSIDYATGTVSYAGSMSFPYRPAGTTAPYVTSVDVKVYGQDVSPYLTDVSDEEIEFLYPWTDATDLIIVHYQINGAAQQNVQMPYWQLNGKEYGYIKVFNLKPGDVIDYSFTVIENGVGFDTETFSYIKPEIFGNAGQSQQATEISFTSSAITYVNENDVNWVIAHYTVNGLQQNVMMTKVAENTWTYDAGLSVGDEVEYFFTFEIQGLGAQDTPVATTTVTE